MPACRGESAEIWCATRAWCARMRQWLDSQRILQSGILGKDVRARKMG